VPRITRLGRRAGPLGVALTLYDLYRRLPPKQRRQVLNFTRKHGPRVARLAFEKGRAARAGRRR